jgi:hypothetical protein
VFGSIQRDQHPTVQALELRQRPGGGDRAHDGPSNAADAVPSSIRRM